jgi:outer membrane protein assembly factor BamA
MLIQSLSSTTTATKTRSRQQANILLVLFVLCFACPVLLAAQEFQLADVTVEGTEQYSREAITKAAGLEIGGPVSVAKLNQAAQELSELGVFRSVRYKYRTRAKSLSLVLLVADNPALQDCAFTNFVWFTREEILDHIQQTVPLFKGKAPLNGRQLSKIILSLDQLLSARGLRGAVQHLPSLPYQGAPMELAVNSFTMGGISLPMQSFQFLDASPTMNRLLQQEADRLNGMDYDRSFLASFAQKQLLPVYYSYGYLQAQIQKARVELLPGAESRQPVAVSFPVTEGPVFTIAGIRWVGAEALSPEKLAAATSLHAGDTANTIQLTNDLKEIQTKQYGSVGYLDAQLKPRIETHPDTLQATFHIQVIEGAQYRFESVAFSDFTGSVNKLKGQLRKSWKMKTGDVYDANYVSDFLKKTIPRILGRGGARVSSLSLHTDKDTEKHIVRLVFQFK